MLKLCFTFHHFFRIMNKTYAGIIEYMFFTCFMFCDDVPAERIYICMSWQGSVINAICVERSTDVKTHIHTDEHLLRLNIADQRRRKGLPGRNRVRSPHRCTFARLESFPIGWAGKSRFVVLWRDTGARGQRCSCLPYFFTAVLSLLCVLSTVSIRKPQLLAVKWFIFIKWQ